MVAISKQRRRDSDETRARRSQLDRQLPAPAAAGVSVPGWPTRASFRSQISICLRYLNSAPQRAENRVAGTFRSALVLRTGKKLGPDCTGLILVVRSLKRAARLERTSAGGRLEVLIFDVG
jgi:hypothetical protein